MPKPIDIETAVRECLKALNDADISDAERDRLLDKLIAGLRDIYLHPKGGEDDGETEPERA